MPSQTRQEDGAVRLYLNDMLEKGAGTSQELINRARAERPGRPKRGAHFTVLQRRWLIRVFLLANYWANADKAPYLE